MSETADQTAPAAAGKPPKAPKTGLPAATEPPRSVEPLKPDRTSFFEETMYRLFAYAPIGMLPEDLNGPAAFTLLAGDGQDRLHVGTDIRVVSDEWLADVVIVDAGHGYAIGQVTQVVPLPPHRDSQADRVPAGFKVRAARRTEQPSVGWLVVRDSDGHIVSAGHILHQEEDAIRYAQQLAKALAR
jgi:hypothetical protein